LPSNFSATDPARISPFGDEVAPFSAARQSAHLGTNAFTSPTSFGCGCAALKVDVRLMGRGLFGDILVLDASFEYALSV